MGGFGSECGPGQLTLSQMAQRALYNPRGLQKYFSNLWRTRKKNDGTGAGGVFIACIGDSDFQGNGPEFTSRSNFDFDTVPHLLSNILQTHLNPPGVVGGYGPLCVDWGSTTSFRTPSRATAASAGWAVFAPLNLPGTGGAPGWLTAQSDNTAQRYALFDFNVASDPDLSHKLAATHICLLGVQGEVAKTDIYAKPANNTPVIIGTGAMGAYSDTMANGAGGVWGARTPIQQINGGVAPTVDYRVQIYNASAASNLYLQYLWLFNGDKDCGIQVGNFGMSGLTASDWAGGTDTLAALGQLAAGGSTIDKNMFLLIIMVGKNDLAIGRTKAQFKADIQTKITAAKAWANSPPVLIVSQLPRYENPYQDKYISYGPYIAAMQELCDNDVANVSFFDAWSMRNYMRSQDLTGGEIQSDSVHHSVKFNRYVLAPALASVLIPRTELLGY